MKIDSVHEPVSAPIIFGPSDGPDDAAKTRELIQAVKAVNAAELFGSNSELTFLLDRETRRPIVRIVDRKTHEVIRQIPPEYVLELARDAKAALEASFSDDKAQ